MHRLPGLDLLRSIAIVWVMFFHTFLIGGLGPDWTWPRAIEAGSMPA
ncbi:hypothetical protein [Pelomonas sp. Root1217]|nr:hypothetical protein [Pelomonas sp. Root1217]